MYLYFSNDTFSGRSQNLVLLIHKCNALGYSTFRCVPRFEGVTNWYQSQGHRIRIRQTPDTASSPTITGLHTRPRGSTDTASSSGRVPDYVPEPIYPEYIPLENEHEFPAEEQPLPPIDSPTAESPGYVTELDPEEYEDDETEDSPVDYPMDGGDDGDDD
ncbi:hypothetical protein Tco_0995697 [Tanacetum coccineum]